MDVQLTLTDQQKLIDLFSQYYSVEDISSIGRLIGIDKNRYQGYGMNMFQLSESFISIVVRNEKMQDLLNIILTNAQYSRSVFKEFDRFIGNEDLDVYNEKKISKNLYAMLIGVNEYQSNWFETLTCAAADVEDISIFLKNQWNIPDKAIKIYKSKVFYQDVMNEIITMCNNLTENDNIIFYFSGHGTEVKGHSYLIMTDTEIDDEDNIINAISLEKLNSIIKKCKANLKIRFFDACQCGEKFIKGIGSKSTMTEKMKKELLATGNGWITFCSCDQDEYSREMPSIGHGVFTYCVLEGLKGQARRESNKMYIEDLKIYVCENVPKLVNDKTYPQNPQYQCEVEGNILIE